MTFPLRPMLRILLQKEEFKYTAILHKTLVLRPLGQFDGGGLGAAGPEGTDCLGKQDPPGP